MADDQSASAPIPPPPPVPSSAAPLLQHSKALPKQTASPTNNLAFSSTAAAAPPTAPPKPLSTPPAPPPPAPAPAAPDPKCLAALAAQPSPSAPVPAPVPASPVTTTTTTPATTTPTTTPAHTIQSLDPSAAAEAAAAAAAATAAAAASAAASASTSVPTSAPAPTATPAVTPAATPAATPAVIPAATSIPAPTPTPALTPAPTVVSPASTATPTSAVSVVDPSSKTHTLLTTAHPNPANPPPPVVPSAPAAPVASPSTTVATAQMSTTPNPATTVTGTQPVSGSPIQPKTVTGTPAPTGPGPETVEPPTNIVNDAATTDDSMIKPASKVQLVVGLPSNPNPSSSSAPAEMTVPTQRPPEPHFTVPVEDDPVRRYLDIKAKDEKAANASPAELQEWCELAWHRIPLNVQQAFDSFDMVRLPRSDITHCLFTLNLKSHTILRVDIQRRILAIKLVQRQISLLAVVECKNEVDKSNPSLATEQHRLIRSLPPTSVWRNPSTRRETIPDDIPWTSGDIPIFDDNGNVIPGQPILPPPGTLPPNDDRPRQKVSRAKPSRPSTSRRKRESSIAGQSGSERGTGASATMGGNDNARDASSGEKNGAQQQPQLVFNQQHQLQAKQEVTSTSGGDNTVTSNGKEDTFDGSEYCRLLHVLCDDRSIQALEAVVQPIPGYDPWVTSIAPLFNDTKFVPVPNRNYTGGVQPSDLAAINPQFVLRNRSGRLLASKFAELKQLYQTAVRNYARNDRLEASFSECNPSHPFLSYVFCLCETNKMLESVMLKNLPRPDGPPVKKRRMASNAATAQNSNMGMDEIVTVRTGQTARHSSAPVGDASGNHSNGSRKGASSTPNNIGANANSMDLDEAAIGEERTTDDEHVNPVTSARRRMERLHSTLAENDKTVFETEEARVRMVTAILVAIREARAFAAEAKTSEDRSICETVLRQLHAKLSDQVNIQPYR